MATAESRQTCDDWCFGRELTSREPGEWRNSNSFTYVYFEGRARKAMKHYQRALGGNIDLQPAVPGERVMSTRLVADGVVIVGTDGECDYPTTVGENMALALSDTDKARLTELFDILAEGGTVKMPLTRQAWGAEIGWCADKLLIKWNGTIQPE
jgi:PhnB protein